MRPKLDRRRFVKLGVAAVSLRLAGRAKTAPLAPVELDLGEAAASIECGRTTPLELTDACLERIDELEPVLNAFITVTADEARAQAHALTRELEHGRRRGPLHGIPIALKDNIDVRGVPTTAATAAWVDRVPEEDAEVVRRLREAGAVLLGKLNMDACAYGVSTTSGIFGPTQNPWRAGYVAGGSSGGPAAAVSARMCFGALGTDTGGSIRLPAAYCGVVGLKPTFGLVSARGVIPLSRSLDHVGPLCRTAADAALLLQAIAGFDPGDTASRPVPVGDYVAGLNQATGGWRLGRPSGEYFSALDADVEAAVEDAIARLARITARTDRVALPPLPNLPVMFVEARQYFAPLLEKFPGKFPAAIEGLVGMGERISAADYAEALRELDRLRRSVVDVFSRVELLVSPTTPGLPPTIAASRQQEARPGPPLSARNTMPFNLYGLPTVSVPCGISASGLPIGLQISGPPGGEVRVLALAAAYQRETQWHRRMPPLPA